MRFIIFLFISIDICFASTKLNEMWNERLRRALIFEPGLNWVQMVAGIGLPSQIEGQSITFGPVVKSYFALPINSTEFTDPQFIIPANARRKNRSIHISKLYEIIIGLLNSYKITDSKACLLRAICETSRIPLSHNLGLLNEIMHIILTPSLSNKKNESQPDNDYIAAEKLGKRGECQHYYSDCKNDWFSVFTSITYPRIGI